MNKSHIKAFYSSVAVLLFSMFYTVVPAQSTLRIIGTVEHNMNPVSGAKVILYKDGNQVETQISDHRGEFQFSMELGYEYLISIKHAGYYGKKIAFNTEVPDEITGKWTMEFAMSLFKGCDGVDASTLDDPVDRIKYSANQSDFISDESYVMNMRGRMERLLSDIDKCQTNKYQQALADGNKLMQQGSYAEAMEKFEEAMEFFPDDRTASRKLAEAEKKLQSSQQSEQLYAKAIAEADQLFAEKNYMAAKTKYNAALRYKPDDYARQRVAEINQITQEQYQEEQAQLATDREYSSLIAKANAAASSNDYIAAKQFYDQATQVKPDASFPKQKSAEMVPLIAKQKQEVVEKEAAKKAYSEAMAMGQTAMAKGDYKTARQHFQRALMMNPEQSLAREKIREAEEKEEERRMAQMKAEKASQIQKMEAALDDGDDLLAKNDYEGAAAAYQRALQLDPNDAYAQKQLNKVKSLQLAATAAKQKALEQSFSQAIDKGDDLLAANNYEQAITVYKQALLQKPNDPVASNKLAQAEQRLAAKQQQLANEQARQRDYESLLTKGNNFFTAKQYTQAKVSYEAALALYPTQSAPRVKIQEIDRLLAEQEKQNQFKALVTKADGLLSARDYVEARSVYQQALAINASDSYVRQKITEIDRIEQEQRSEAEAQKMREAQYARSIREADNFMAMSRYTEAKGAYQRAMGYKPDDSYCTQQIAKIDGILAEKLRRENERKAQDENYRQTITKADQAFTSGDYTLAKTTYQQALALKASEIYPRQKIAEIDEIIRRNEQLAAQQKALNMRYSEAIKQADILIAANKFEEAKTAYKTASGIKPQETYPKEQIVKIEGLIADKLRQENEQRAKEQKYNLEIAKADKALADNNLPLAKQAYQSALVIKPVETYPKQQINKIEELLAQAEREKQEKAAFEQKYKTLLAKADAAYNKRDYETAKPAYKEALEMKPGDSYPQQQLNKIIEFERLIALQKANQKTTKTNTSSATKPQAKSPSKLAVLNFANDSERDKYLNKLKTNYPVGVTLEVHKEKTSTTHRYVVIRNGEAREFRKVSFNWGGVEYSDNGIPTTGQYFDSQVKKRDDEFFQKFEY